jgi:CBS domain-containing protein
MRRHHVGDVIVVDSNQEGARIPIGIVTDRDILVETIALDIDAKLFTAGDLMTSPVTTVIEDASVVEALAVMRSKKVRRLPVVTHSGTLFGIITADDVVNLLASELSMVAGLIVEQSVKEGRLRK